MATDFLGSVTVADVIAPSGFAGVLAKITAAYAAIRASLSAMVSFKAAIRIAAVLDLEAQFNAALAVQLGLGLSLTDPAAYLAGLLSGLIQVQANIALLVPSIALSAQLTASLAISAEIAAKIAAFDLVLAGIDSINFAISAAISFSLPALPALAGGVYAYTYNGPVSGLGTSLDSTVPGTSGLAPGTNIKTFVFVVDTGNVPALAGMNLLLLAS